MEENKNDFFSPLKQKNKPSSIILIITIVLFSLGALMLFIDFAMTNKKEVSSDGVIIEEPIQELFTKEEKVALLHNQSDEDKGFYEIVDEDMNLLRGYQKINDETIGIITIRDTLLRHPLMQSFEQEDYYLFRDIAKEDNPTGVPFLSLDSDLDRINGNNVIYGHNIRKYYRDVFCDLEFYEDAEFYKEHPVIEIVTNKGTAKYIIFAYYLVDTSDDDCFEYWTTTYWGSRTNYREYMQEVEKRNWLITDVPYDYDDQFISLSSCSVELSGIGTNKMVVMARRLKVGEDYSQYIKNAKINDNPVLPDKLTKKK